MPRRLPATPPGAPPPDDPDPDGLLDDDLLDDEEDLLDDVELEHLPDDGLEDPDAWPDDPEPSIPAEALDDPAELDAADTEGLLEPVDDEPLPGAAAADDDPLLDTGTELLEPDHDDLEGRTVVGVELVVRLAADGRELPALADTASAVSVWEAPGAEPATVVAELVIAGERLTLTLTRRPSDRERICLGRDALADRFLVRP